MNKKVSIIIPIYKSELWLSRCLDSIVNQTYSNIEIILINDGSPDKSGEICEKYAKVDNRIRVVHQENKGVSESRNLGLDMATGEYIMFVDSDDWIERNMCEILINKMINSNSDLVICGLNITKFGESLRKPTLPEGDFIIRDSEEIYWHLRKINLGPCNKLYKKIYIKSRFDTTKSLGEDTIFVIDYMKNINKVSIVETCLYNVRLDNENSLNRKHRGNKLDLLLDLRREEMEGYTYMYGENCNKSFLYNEYILNLHACFRDVVKYDNKEVSLNYIEKYLNMLEKEIENMTNNSIFKRIDYKIFNYLLKIRKKYLIYYFFKMKLKIAE